MARRSRDGEEQAAEKGYEDATPLQFLHTQAPPFISPLPEGGESYPTFATHPRAAVATCFPVGGDVTGTPAIPEPW